MNGFYCLYVKIQHYVICKVSDNGQASYVNNYCCIQLEGLLYYDDCNLLGIIQFLVFFLGSDQLLVSGSTTAAIVARKSDDSGLPSTIQVLCVDAVSILSSFLCIL